MRWVSSWIKISTSLHEMLPTGHQTTVKSNQNISNKDLSAQKLTFYNWNSQNAHNTTTYVFYAFSSNFYALKNVISYITKAGIFCTLQRELMRTRRYGNYRHSLHLQAAAVWSEPWCGSLSARRWSSPPLSVQTPSPGCLLTSYMHCSLTLYIRNNRCQFSMYVQQLS